MAVLRIPFRHSEVPARTLTRVMGSVIKKATVFEFLIRDQSSGNFVIAPRKATLEAIQLIGGRLLPRSAEVVDESRLDENGFLMARLS